MSASWVPTSPRRRSPLSDSAARSPREGVSPRGSTRLGDERRAAPTCPRRSYAWSYPATSARAAPSGSRRPRSARRPGRDTSRNVVYRLLPEDGTLGPGAGVPLGLVALNSEIAFSANGQTIPAGPVEVRGYAFPGGERYVARVDVSLNSGSTWLPAELRDDLGPWAWRHWRIVANPNPETMRSSSALGTPRQPSSRRTRRPCGVRRATSTTPAHASMSAPSSNVHATRCEHPQHPLGDFLNCRDPVTSAGVGRGEQLEAVRSANDTSVLTK
jgi:hypothetical protein